MTHTSATSATSRTTALASTATSADVLMGAEPFDGDAVDDAAMLGPVATTVWVSALIVSRICR